MGASNSRSSDRMSANEGDPPQEHQDPDGILDDEDLVTVAEDELRSDIISLISRLIQSGEVHILSDPMHDEDSDEVDDESDYSFMNRHNVRPHKVIGSPDTSVIDGSDLKQLVLAHSGRLHKTSRQQHHDIMHMITKRQFGVCGNESFSPSEQCRISASLLPNSPELVDRYSQKAFCGVYAEDGNTFLTAAQDQYVRIYDTSGDRFHQTKKIRARDVGWSIIDTAFSPDGQKFIYSSWSDYVHICNLYGDYENHKALDMNPRTDRFCIFSLEFTRDGTEFIGGANDGYLYIYDLDREERVSRIEAHEDDVDSVALADGTSQIIYSGGDDGLVKVWDRRTLDESNPVPVGVLAGHKDGITYVDSKGDARYLLSNCKDQSMKLWDIRKFSTKEAQQATLAAVAKQTWDYRWQKFPHKVLHEKTIEGDSSLMTYRGHSILNTLIRCHFSPMHTTGQRYVYTGCATGRVVVYDILTGEKVAALEAHRGCTRDVAWHPYKPIIMSASWDCTIRRSTVQRSVDSDCLSSDSEDDSEREPGRKWSRRRGGGLRALRNSLRARRSRVN